MLSDRSSDTLRPLVMTLRIIVIALSLGVISLAAFAAFQNAGKPQTFGTKVNYLFLAMSGPLFLAGFIVPRLLPKDRAMQPLDAAEKQQDEAAAVQTAFASVQIATIVGCALFEGMCFLNLITYLQDAELVHLAVSGLGLLCILAHFPILSRIELRIEDQLQAQRDEQQFKS